MPVCCPLALYCLLCESPSSGFAKTRGLSRAPPVLTKEFSCTATPLGFHIPKAQGVTCSRSFLLAEVCPGSLSSKAKVVLRGWCEGSHLSTPAGGGEPEGLSLEPRSSLCL